MEISEPKRIKINIGGVIFRGTLNDTNTAAEIYRILPFQSRGETWGQEIYFYTPIKMANEAPVTEVKLGDIAYWPEGHALCLFLGLTPLSPSTNKIIPAAPVTVVGKVDAKLGDFLKIKQFVVKIEKDLTSEK
ncbi:MAG: cyclophilin-like fold protein [candidate division WOR-3 bacterium]